MPGAEIVICSVEEAVEGEPLQVETALGTLAVFNIGGEVYVTEDACTHLRASLSQEGELEGFTITCGWHRGAFDVRTGSVLAKPCRKPLKTFPAIISNGKVLVPLPE